MRAGNRNMNNVSRHAHAHTHVQKSSIGVTDRPVDTMYYCALLFVRLGRDPRGRELKVKMDKTRVSVKHPCLQDGGSSNRLENCLARSGEICEAKS